MVKSPFALKTVMQSKLEFVLEEQKESLQQFRSKRYQQVFQLKPKQFVGVLV